MRTLGEHWEPSGLLNRPLPGRKKCCMAFCIFHMIAAITKLGGTSHNVTWGFTVEKQRCHSSFMKRSSRGAPKDALESVSTLDVGPHIFRRVQWHQMAQLVKISVSYLVALEIYPFTLSDLSGIGTAILFSCFDAWPENQTSR